MSTVPVAQSRSALPRLESMYQRLFVPVDNSPHSNRAVDCALQLGKVFDSTLTGCHVYAARMHDYRFKQMEFTLPEEYLQEQELERQRRIHNSLIQMGLELISDCYLEDMDRKCLEQGLPFERKTMDGKHSTELLKEIRSSGYDLVVMGAVGIGKVKDSVLGAVCERVTRSCPTDVWVVKHLPREDEPERETILVGIDGSPQSFGALRVGMELARRFDKRLELIAVYDPYLHYAVFKGIVDVLTEKAARVFRFEEQNQLHEEIIDTGLAQIYQSHLEVAASVARQGGVEVTTTLLDGKAFQKILDHSRRTSPWLLILGRVGIHGSEANTDLGSNSENLLRLAPCDLLLTTRLEYPELDLKADASIHWTAEAEERMKRVPEIVRGIARTGILRLAVEKGHSVVTNSLVTEAMERFMPSQRAGSTAKLAESLAFEKALQQPISICRKCGLAARVPEPVECSVCGSIDFEVVTREMIEKLAEAEGGIQEESTYDGRKIQWTREARRALHGIEDEYQMRRCKARIEKKARLGRLETITLGFARNVIGEETGGSFLAGEGPVASSEAIDGGGESRDLPPIVAKDPRGNPLRSHFQWTGEALERIFRVPPGFMRSKTQERTEELASQKGFAEISLDAVEDGIEMGRRMMAEMTGQCSAGQNDPKPAQTDDNRQRWAEQAEPQQVCPAPVTAAPEAGSPPGKSNGKGSSAALNEAGWLSEMARKRKNLLD